MVAPIAYIYILLMLLRDLCLYFPETVYQTLQHYVPWLARLADHMNNASRIMDVWCVIEALFFIACKMKIWYLQRKDPLEASLSAAPMMDHEDRKLLWDRIIETEQDDPIKFISGWFFDQPIERISRYDVYDFLCWSMFDGRNQEHLTTEELHDLEVFLEDLEYQISLQVYGENVETEIPRSTSNVDIVDENDNPNEEAEESPSKPVRHSEDRDDDDTITSASDVTNSVQRRRPRPRQMFRFSVDNQREEPTFFSNLFESYKDRYDRYRSMIENAEFHPVQDFRNILAEKAHQAEESAQIVYETFIQPGSSMDKHLSALSQATSSQLSEAWNSVKGMKERLETANFLSERRNALMEQLRGNRAMLNRMREMPYAVPSGQMAALMRKVTESYDALTQLEQRATHAFVNATGALADRGQALFPQKEPQRYAKYSADPLLQIATYPLGFHLFVLLGSEIPLRIMLKNRGFQKRHVGPVAYYHFAGAPDDETDSGSNKKKKMPIVFIHGIGIGLIAYIQLIDYFLETGRPILLPEIPYVSGFRPWQGPNSVLSPAVVASTMTAMLATHRYPKATFCGHSYGTSWLSYVCKYTPSIVAAALFLDPICYCLHHPRLTKNFVYSRPDPGTVSFMIRTDMIINWTIQRAFPWAWISLFVDQVSCPCTVFLSDDDALVPAKKVESYFRSKGISICDADALDDKFFEESGDFNACVFRGKIHGAFTEDPSLLPPIAVACNRLCEKVEGRAMY